MNRFLIALLLIVVVLLVVPISSFAKEGVLQQSSEQAKVEYTLPYPGILPGSPLYFLKVFRDRLVSFLISDPLKKAEFDLLASDKRLGAAVSLFEKGKKELAESTISKGENYFEDAVKNIKLAKKQGRDIEGLLKNMFLSSSKHLEIILSLKEKTEGQLFKKFETLEMRMLEFQIQVEQLKLE